MVQRWGGGTWATRTQTRLARDDAWLTDIAMTPTRQWAVGSYVAADGNERPYIQQRCTG